MSWEEWRWDPTLFEGTAPYYAIGRLPYAPGGAEALASELGLDGTGRLLDVGCGPGVIGAAFAHLFADVVGIDADPGMVAEAARLGVPNARWVHLRAEELPAALGIFRVVSFAASFHWMDRPVVAELVREMLEPGGAVVQLDSENDLPAADVVEAVRVRYLGADRRAGQAIRNTSPDGEDEVFQAAGFAPAVEVPLPDGRVLHRSIDQVIAQVLSMSGTAPHLFGDRLADFEAELRAALVDRAPDGMFPVTLRDNRIRFWRLC